VSTERTGSAVVVAQTGHEDFICRLFAILGFSVVCELERFPEVPSGEIGEAFGDNHLHLSISEARDVDLFGCRHSAS